jgi:hypothetical protein
VKTEKNGRPGPLSGRKIPKPVKIAKEHCDERSNRINALLQSHYERLLASLAGDDATDETSCDERTGSNAPTD